jgi:phosphate acetyltransferase
MNLQITKYFRYRLTGNIVPDEYSKINRRVRIVPIISVEGGTYSITNKIGDIKAEDLC